jgi:hypothetical protein
MAATPATLAQRIGRHYEKHVDYRRRAAVGVFLSLAATFAFLRALTAAIRFGLLPIPNLVTNGGLHIHHFVWGIFLTLVVGFLALVLDQPTWHPRLAVPFGIGMALTLDEFALWLNLRDVYWQHQGRLSVELVLGCLALLGVYLFGFRFWHAAVREVTRTIHPRLAGGPDADTQGR